MKDKYTMKIPFELKDFFEKYIKEHKELGFNFASQFILHILQEEAKKLTEKKEEKKITLPSREYSKEELEKLIRES